MPTITALRPARRRPGFVRLEVDDTPLGLLSEREVEALGLHVGQTLDEQALADLQGDSQVTEALNLANHYLAHRPRTTAEVRTRLRQAGHEEQTITAALEKLAMLGLLDDTRFASLWVENRAAFSPRAPRLLEMELRRKGVDRETIAATLADSEPGDEERQAIEAGRKRLRAFAGADEQIFRRRMGAYLARRGFGYEVAGPALTALWAEANGTAGDG